MRKLFITIGIIFGFQSLNAQSSNDCAIDTVKDYIVKMGISDSTNIKATSIFFSEVLKKTELEKESNGVFIASNLNAHRRKLILLKRDNQIKLLTFSNVSKSMVELISFLNDIKVSDEDLFKYIDFIHQYIESSKSNIKVINKLDNSTWIDCK